MLGHSELLIVVLCCLCVGVCHVCVNSLRGQVFHEADLARA